MATEVTEGDPPTEESIGVQLDAGGEVVVSLTAVMMSALTPRERRYVCRILDAMDRLSNPPTGDTRDQDA